MQKLFASVGGDDDLEYGANQELDREFEKWRLQYAPYFLKHYGQVQLECTAVWCMYHGQDYALGQS